MERAEPHILDLLSEMLAVQREAQRLYDLLQPDAGAEQRLKLREYAEQSRRDSLVLEEAIRRLGGDIAHVSPGAEVVHQTTDAVIEVTGGAQARGWLYRVLHLATFEMRDRMIWRALDALGRSRDDAVGETLRMAATAVLSREALGAGDADSTDQRIDWIMRTTEDQLAAEIGAEVADGR